jgi:beta-galactosidase
LFDTCCFEKPVGYLRESLWSDKPMVYVAVAPPSQRGSYGRGIGALRSHWNWEGDPRKQVPVVAFSNCKTVELFLNGNSLGKKSPADSPNHLCRWLVRYQPGELKAVGTSDDGKTVEYSLNTAGKPDHLELITDRKQLASNGEDAANVEVRLVDDKGVLVPNDDVTCSLQVTGAGQLLSVDNGNLFDTTPLSSSSRKLNNGRELAVVESSRSHGSIILKVTAPGLPDATLKLHSGGIL